MSNRYASEPSIEDEETEAYQEFRYKRMADIARAVAHTPDGRRLLGFIMFEAGGLMLVGVNEGRRELASVVYNLLDRTEPGLAEQIALEERKLLQEDNLNIATAIKKRSEDDAG